MQNLEELFVDKLKDVYDAEKRITRALPKMAKAATSEELATAFEEHLQQTEEQIERLDRIFKNLDVTPGRKQCHGMMGILEEGQEMMGKDASEEVMDVALIASAQEVEHYEIGAYGCLKTWAELLGRTDEAKLLQQTLEEEEETDEKLTSLASDLNPRAMEGAEGEEEETEDEENVVMAGSQQRGRTTGGRSTGSKTGNTRTGGRSSTRRSR